MGFKAAPAPSPALPRYRGEGGNGATNSLSRGAGEGRGGGSAIRALLILFAFLLPFSAHAVSNPAEMLPDTTQEERARTLGREIRCMVCQNQSIEDSEAELARDLRLIVRERISAGDSDNQVLTFLHARYGDFVLLKPPFSWSTALLWATPLVAVTAGLGLIFASRRRAAPAAPAPLTEEERRRLAALGLTPDGDRTTRA